MRVLSKLAFATALIFSTTSAVEAESNLLFILDASNSMWGQVDGIAKIETAKKAFNNLVSDLPDGVNVGLAAYGHTDKTSCTDVNFLTAFVDKSDSDILSDAIAKITPTGKTPIAYSLEMLGTVMTNKFKDQQNDIVLISDGIETCSGDPCAVAETLASNGLNFRVHVVGFDIAEEDRKQLECIAEKGQGKYFSANSSESFSTAIDEVVKVATNAAPVVLEPAPEHEPVATLKEFFRDDFDGEELADHWQILNPNIDNFIVDEGQLLILDNKWANPTNETISNLFMLDQELPKGDWTVTARVNMPIQTGRETFRIVLFDEHTKWIGASLLAYQFDNLTRIGIDVEKRSGDDFINFRNRFSGHNMPVNYEDSAPYELQLVKKGRQYSSQITSVADPELVFQTNTVSLLRPKGKIALSFTQNYDVKGEGQIEIDWVKIEVAE